jgi:polyisoprenoid-binding protein YceI
MSITTDIRVPTGTWRLDPVHSTIGFEVDYLSGSFRGQFREVEAKLEVGEITRLTGSANVGSVDVKDETLSTHLQSPDFFDAERHPELRFESSEIDLAAESATVGGQLTIKGVTKPIELTGTIAPPITDFAERERIGLRLETTLDRTDFGVDWNAPLPSGEPALANEVRLAADLYFVREA